MKVMTRLLATATFLLLTSCDPGVRYHPVDGWWLVYQTKVKGIEVSLRPVGGLIGMTMLSPDLEIRNESAQAVRVEGATLRCGRSAYEAETARLRGTQSLLPGDADEVVLHWDFKKPIGTILRDSVSMTLRLRLGSEPFDLAIPMVRGD